MESYELCNSIRKRIEDVRTKAIRHAEICNDLLDKVQSCLEKNKNIISLAYFSNYAEELLDIVCIPGSNIRPLITDLVKICGRFEKGILDWRTNRRDSDAHGVYLQYTNKAERIAVRVNNPSTCKVTFKEVAVEALPEMPATTKLVAVIDCGKDAE